MVNWGLPTVSTTVTFTDVCKETTKDLDPTWHWRAVACFRHSSFKRWSWGRFSWLFQCRQNFVICKAIWAGHWHQNICRYMPRNQTACEITRGFKHCFGGDCIYFFISHCIGCEYCIWCEFENSFLWNVRRFVSLTTSSAAWTFSQILLSIQCLYGREGSVDTHIETCHRTQLERRSHMYMSTFRDKKYQMSTLVCQHILHCKQCLMYNKAV